MNNKVKSHSKSIRKLGNYTKSPIKIFENNIVK